MSSEACATGRRCWVSIFHASVRSSMRLLASAMSEAIGSAAAKRAT